MSARMVSALAVLVWLCAAAGCSSSAEINTAASTGGDATSGGTDIKGSGGERCNAGVANREVSEYDTSGDGVPDVRKVYLSVGSGLDARLVMICRETDINSDGHKDIVRYYDDFGRSTREESDRNFDGKMDLAVVYQDGKIVRKEIDEDRDGTIDTMVYYDGDKPLRSEKDTQGRSTEKTWRPDRWEYFEKGMIVRVGIDIDGDSRVDRWDRDLEFRREQEKEDAEAIEREIAEEQGVDIIEKDEEDGES